MKLERKFNVTGTCVPTEDYMVDITEKLVQIKIMIDRREYFTINRGRQYGKTTTLSQLKLFLANEYTVISISFEGFGSVAFETEERFCQTFLKTVKKALRFSGVTNEYREAWINDEIKAFSDLSDHITDLCEDKKVVLMIDEVDKASNHVIFLDFLSKLRDKYLSRKVEEDFTFHSVILAGVYDIKNLKLKMIQEGIYAPIETETTTYNSPWNIASTFKVDMAFSEAEIAGMLVEYEEDHQTGMNIDDISKEISEYTSGYPVLVSSICKYIDEELSRDWTTAGVRRAVKLILKEKTPLFDNLIKNLDSNKSLFSLLSYMVLNSRNWSFNPDDEMINIGMRYGYLKENNGKVEIANKIFKVRLLNYFTAKKRKRSNC